MKLNSDAKPIPYGEELGKRKQDALAERNGIVEGDDIPVGPLPSPPMELQAVHGDVPASEMTMRERFAMAALQGLAASPHHPGESWPTIVGKAVCAADYLIAELQK